MEQVKYLEKHSPVQALCLRSKSLPHVDLKRVKLQKQDSNLSDDSSSGFKDSGIEHDDNLANIEIQQDFPSIQSNSSSGVEPVRERLDMCEL